MGWVGGLGVIIESNLNRVRLSCCWVGVGLGCDNKKMVHSRKEMELFFTILDLFLIQSLV